MKSPSSKSLILSVFCSGVLASACQAAVLVNDNFTLSSGTDVGIVNNTEATGVGTYSTIQSAGSLTGMTVTTASGFGSGNVLSFANNTNTYYRAFNSAGFSLNSLALNETLKMTYSIRVDGGTLAAAQNFSFGFVNTTSANSVLYANVDLNAGASEFRYRTGSFNMSDAGLAIGTSWTEPVTVSASSYTFDLSVTKLSTGFLLEYSRDGALLGNSTQLNASAWATAEAAATITGVAFRWAQTPGVVTYIDNVVVSTVPEPTAAILALGGLGLICLRRRASFRNC